VQIPLTWLATQPARRWLAGHFFPRRCARIRATSFLALPGPLCRGRAGQAFSQACGSRRCAATNAIMEEKCRCPCKPWRLRLDMSLFETVGLHAVVETCSKRRRGAKLSVSSSLASNQLSLGNNDNDQSKYLSFSSQWHIQRQLSVASCWNVKISTQTYASRPDMPGSQLFQLVVVSLWLVA